MSEEQRIKEQFRAIIENNEREEEWYKTNLVAREQGKWFKMWLAMGQILGYTHILFCPVCGAPASTHLVFKCHPDNTLPDVNELVKQKVSEGALKVKTEIQKELEK